MRRKLAILVLLVPVACGQTFGILYSSADYYVDSVNGSDSNPGTLSAANIPQPYQTISKLLMQSLAGKIVALASGSQWRESLIVPAGSLQFFGYGSGALPIFDGADVLTNGSFTLYDVASNTYRIAHAADRSTANGAWEAGVLLSGQASIAAVEATAGTSYYDNVGHFTYIHSANGDPSPLTNGLLYEASTRSEVVQDGSGFNGNRYIGFQVQHGYSDLSAMLIAGNGNYFSGLKFYQNANHHLSLYGGNNLGEDLYGENCAGGSFLFYTVNSTGNILRRVTSMGTQAWTGPAFQTHNTATNNQVLDSTISQTVNQTVAGSAVLVSDSGTNITILRAAISGNWLHFFSAEASGGAGSLFAYNTLNGSTVLQSSAVNLSTGATGVKVYNNTFYNTAGRPFVSCASGCTVSMLNNLTQASDLYENTAIGGITANYNLWFGSGRGSPFNTDLGAKTYAQWRALGFDSNGLNVDPLLTNPSGGVFTLQGGSPAIGAGIYIAGISTSIPPNIGAK